MGEVVIPLESLGTFLWLAEYLELNLAPEEKDGWVALEQQRDTKKTTTVSGEIQIRASYLAEGQAAITVEETNDAEAETVEDQTFTTEVPLEVVPVDETREIELVTPVVVPVPVPASSEVVGATPSNVTAAAIQEEQPIVERAENKREEQTREATHLEVEAQKEEEEVQPETVQQTTISESESEIPQTRSIPPEEEPLKVVGSSRSDKLKLKVIAGRQLVSKDSNGMKRIA